MDEEIYSLIDKLAFQTKEQLVNTLSLKNLKWKIFWFSEG